MIRRSWQTCWEDFRGQISDKGGEVLEPKWLGALVPHHCRCDKGHECRPIPHSIQRGDGMCRICTGRDSVTAWANFRQRVAEAGGEVLEQEWLGNHKPHRCRCINGHACSPRPASVQQNQGMCRICAGRDSVTAWADFRLRVAEAGGVVLEPKWLGVNTPHRCRCARGHEWKPTPGNVRQGHRTCCTCKWIDHTDSRSDPAWDIFQKKIAEQGGEVLEQGWLGSNRPHRCRCINGHECRPRPSGIQRYGMCMVCARNDPVTARKEFFSRVAVQGGVVLEPEWLGKSKPHRCRCAKGHDCSPRPNSVRDGQGICRVCSWQGQDVLYVTRNPKTGCIKFGITSRDGSIRLKAHRTDGYTEVLRLITGLPEGLAALAEQKIKLALAMVGAKPARGREYFSDEYLALIENEIANWVPQ